MKNTNNVAVLVGSRRKGSFNRQLAHALAAFGTWVVANTQSSAA